MGGRCSGLGSAMRVDDAAAKLFGIVRVLAIAVTWSRFAGGAVPAFADSWLELVLDAAFWGFSVLAFVGIRARLTTLLTGLTCFGIYYGLGVYGSTDALNSHHVFAQALLTCLVALTPCDRAFALQRSSGPVPLWSQDVLRLQLTMIYAGGVFEKSYAAWLDGTRLEQILHTIYLGSDAVDLGAFAWLLPLGAVAAWASELFLAVAVWKRSWIDAVLGVGFLLHAGIYLLTPVGTFSATMFVFLLAIVPPARFLALTNPVPVVTRPAPPWVLGGFGLLALAPLVGLLGTGPQIRALDGLALLACDVELSRASGPLPTPSFAWSEGVAGVEQAAARACKSAGPVDVHGRCASAEGWVRVDAPQSCPKAPRRPAGRISAW